MTGSTVAKRYALALFQIAKEKQLLDQTETELRVVKESINNNRDLQAVFKSPKLTNEKKKEILTNVFSGVNEYVLNMLKMLIDRHRDGLIAGVVDEFIELSNEEKGIAEAKVYSVRPLTDDERTALSSAFAKKVGKSSLRIENEVDSDLLGGVKIRIGNRIFDGSLKGKLDRLQRQLLG